MKTVKKWLKKHAKRLCAIVCACVFGIVGISGVFAVSTNEASAEGFESDNGLDYITATANLNALGGGISYFMYGRSLLFSSTMPTNLGRAETSVAWKRTAYHQADTAQNNTAQEYFTTGYDYGAYGISYWSSQAQQDTGDMLCAFSMENVYMTMNRFLWLMEKCYFSYDFSADSHIDRFELETYTTLGDVGYRSYYSQVLTCMQNTLLLSYLCSDYENVDVVFTLSEEDYGGYTLEERQIVFIKELTFSVTVPYTESIYGSFCIESPLMGETSAQREKYMITSFHNLVTYRSVYPYFDDIGSSIFNIVESFFDIEVFPNFKLSYFIMISVGAMLFGFVLTMVLKR